MQSRTLLYALAQALTFSIAVTSVSISAIVGSSLATHSSLTTLPYSFQVSAIISCTYLFSMLMAKLGRQKVFLLGALLLSIGGLVGGYSIIWQNFWLNCLAHWVIGMAAAAFMYLRFAATDGLEGKAKSRALSYVTFASIGAAFIGPFVADKTRLWFALHEFAATYFFFIILACVLVPLFLATKNAPLITSSETPDRKLKQAIPKRLWLAALTSGSGFLVMTLVMLQGSLLLQQDVWCGMTLTYTHISNAISWHVVAMFLPSLFMPTLIERFGLNRVLFIGYLILIASLSLGSVTSQYTFILIALIGLGAGWNILYVGGSILVTRLPGDAPRWQGINESCMAIAQTLSAVSAGALFYSIGWQMTQYLALALLLPGLICLIVLWSRLARNEPKVAAAT